MPPALSKNINCSWSLLISNGSTFSVGHSTLISDFFVAFNSCSVKGDPDAISTHRFARSLALFIIFSINLGFLTARSPISLLPLLNLLYQ